jgi:hypothetical protein
MALLLGARQTEIGRHLSVMLPRNWVDSPFGAFVEHSSAFNQVFGVGYWAPR